MGKTQLLAQRGEAGFSLLEVLVVVAIVLLLSIALLLGVNLQLMRSRDAHRKADLEKLKVVFENYYSDNECYPPEDIFFNGGSEPDGSLCGQPLTELSPYLDKVPCDPETELPYAYLPPEGMTVCDGYRLYTKLENETDQGIKRVGCTSNGCGSFTDYNYGVNVGGSLVQTEVIVTPTEVPTPTPNGYPNTFLGTWVCSPNADPQVNGGNPYCKSYNPVAGHGCEASFATSGACSPYCHTGSPIMCDD
jgi:prepilin-type N-terminal cleavage/methylation domain-containing protein